MHLKERATPLLVAAAITGSITLGGSLEACSGNEQDSKAPKSPTTIETIQYPGIEAHKQFFSLVENHSSPSFSKACETLKKTNHLWNASDTELMKYDPDAMLYECQLTFDVTSPFYNGEQPLTILSLEDPNAPLGNIIIAESFSSFTNLYVYDNLATMVGAQTIDAQGRIVADVFIEYPLLDVIDTDEAHWYLHEVHYNRYGEIQFTSKSEMDSQGFKINESKTTGEKKNEYYFSMPFSFGSSKPAPETIPESELTIASL